MNFYLYITGIMIGVESFLQCTLQECSIHENLVKIVDYLLGSQDSGLLLDKGVLYNVNTCIFGQQGIDD